VASILLAQGVPLTVVSAMLGHVDVATTLKIYAHALPGGTRAAADLMGRLLREKAPEGQDAATG
jgi:integrase